MKTKKMKKHSLNMPIVWIIALAVAIGLMAACDLGNGISLGEGEDGSHGNYVLHAYERPVISYPTSRETHDFQLNNPARFFTGNYFWSNRKDHLPRGILYRIDSIDRKGVTLEETHNHIQGHERYGQWHILTHSNDEKNNARIFFHRVGRNDSKNLNMNTPGFDRHPGGIQRIGDYLLIGSSHEGESRVNLMDLRPLRDGILPNPSVQIIYHGNIGTAAAVGITDLYNSRNYSFQGSSDIYTFFQASYRRYLIAVVHYGDGIQLYITGEIRSLSDIGQNIRTDDENTLLSPGLKKLGYVSIPGKNYDGIALVRDTNNNIWMFGFRGEESGFGTGLFGFHSYVDLYQISQSGSNHDIIFLNSYSPPLTQQLSVDQGYYDGMHAITTRYGSSLHLISPDDIMITITERNLAPKKRWPYADLTYTEFNDFDRWGP